MLILDTINDIGIYRVMLIVKNVISIIFTLVPIIVMITATIDMFKYMLNPQEFNKTFRVIAMRFVSGIVVFLIPTILGYAFSLIENYDEDTIFKYYNNASKEKIEELEIQYEKEKSANQAMNLAKLKEASIERKDADKKRNEQMEANVKPDTNQSGSYTGDSTSNGTFGTVTVSNGVFTIPNKRATSDADIPKQSGEYGLNPIFWERLSKLMNDARNNGYNITVTSGWRSYSSQLSLWNNSSRPCSERGKWTACPGGSRHGFGIAADLSFNGTSCSGSWDCNAAAKWVHENAANYGLTFRMSWEPWHIEPAQVVGGSFGSCTAAC